MTPHISPETFGSFGGIFYFCTIEIYVMLATAKAQQDDTANEELVRDFIPTAWNINRERLTHKIEELLCDEWIARVREGFTETLNTALQQ